MKLKKRMVLRKIFRAVGIGTALLAAAVALFIAVSWAVEYRPGERETTICCPEGEIVPLPDTLTILSWNIGYAGLGDNMDFFYDGGRRVRDSRERTARNLKEIVETISRVNPDLALLQEVDLDFAAAATASARSIRCGRRSPAIRSLSRTIIRYVGSPFRCGLRWGAYRQES